MSFRARRHDDGWRPAAAEPRAGQFVLVDACGVALLFIAEIDHILAANLVCAEHIRLEFASEALRRP
jgi:hypothetical protein